jgi:hypothetical protein
MVLAVVDPAPVLTLWWSQDRTADFVAIHCVAIPRALSPALELTSNTAEQSLLRGRLEADEVEPALGM